MLCEPSCGFQISDYMMLPDTATLSERLRVCLQEGDENPRDFTTLFDLSIYQLDTTSLPKVIKSVPVALGAALHSILSVWFENLSLGTGVRVMAYVVCKTCSQVCDEANKDSWEDWGGGRWRGNCGSLLCSRLRIRHLG